MKSLPKLNRIFFLIPVIYVMLAGMGCRNNPKQVLDPAQAESKLTAQPTRKAATVLKHYLELKDALVAGESEGARHAAATMRISLVSLLQDSSLAAVSSGTVPAVQHLADTLMIQLDSLLAVNDKSCEGQRVYFKPVSTAMFSLLLEIDMHHITIYRHLCPMAFNEQGAQWLSLSPEIENPYFGKKMLTCGELIDTLQ